MHVNNKCNVETGAGGDCGYSSVAYILNHTNLKYKPFNVEKLFQKYKDLLLHLSGLKLSELKPLYAQGITTHVLRLVTAASSQKQNVKNILWNTQTSESWLDDTDIQALSNSLEVEIVVWDKKRILFSVCPKMIKGKRHVCQTKGTCLQTQMHLLYKHHHFQALISQDECRANHKNIQ